MSRRPGARTRSMLLAGAAAMMALGCSSNSSGPSDGGNGGGGGGGAVGTVKVGNIFFESGHNGTSNPAQDTVAVGQTVTWTWTLTGAIPHSVQSQGAPSFTSSAEMTGSGMTYTHTFDTPGTYHYDCAVHGSAMSGTIVVQ
ncbi:MAG: plastocyanin/azurin family copper-binding protein [Gemmatimonadales bacterium]